MCTTLRIPILLACLPACLLADFSYEQNTKITGGMMAGVMKFAGAFSKQAREPMQTTVAVKGNRMVSGSKERATVIDLDNETFTQIDFLKKTYSVMTFAEMKQAMEQAMQRMKDAPKQQASTPDPDKPDVKTDFKMDIKDTGKSKEIAGLQAKEMILTMQMEGTDQKSGNKGNMVVTSDMWLAPKIPGYEEVHEFQMKMAKKMASAWGSDSGMGGMMMSRPDVARAMEAARKEGAKMDGTPVLTVMTVGGSAEGQPGDAPPPPSDAKPKQDSPSLSGALSGRLGGFGGFGRKKKDDAAAQSSSTPQQTTTASGVLMETTTETSGFSSAPIDPSRFAVPAGFKKVESGMQKRQR